MYMYIAECVSSHHGRLDRTISKMTNVFTNMSHTNVKVFHFEVFD